MAYHWAAIDTNNEVVPRLNGYLEVLVSQDLEAKCTVSIFWILRGAIRVKAGYKTIQSSEHIVIITVVENALTMKWEVQASKWYLMIGLNHASVLPYLTYSRRR